MSLVAGYLDVKRRCAASPVWAMATHARGRDRVVRWRWPGGCHLLNRGDAEYPVGIAAASATEISEHLTGRGDGEYVYGVRGVGRLGVETESQAEQTLALSGGDVVSPPPSAPLILLARPLADGYAEIEIVIDSRSVVPVASVVIYTDGGTGTVDYASAAATVLAGFSSRLNATIDLGVASGTDVLVAARCRATDGSEETNTNTTTVTADSESPEQVTGLSVGVAE